MIIPMKKVHLMFHNSQLEENVTKLQELGIVDITTNSLNTDTKLGSEYLELSKALQCLEEFIDKNKLKKLSYHDAGNGEHDTSINTIVSDINDNVHTQNTLLKQNEELQSVYAEIESLGDVSLKHIEQLQQYGIDVKVYKAEKKSSLTSDNENIGIYTIKNRGHGVLYAVVQYNTQDFSVPKEWSELDIPHNTPSEMVTTIENNNKQIEGIFDFLEKQIVYLNILKARKLELENILLRNNVVDTSSKFIDDQIVVIEGFVPQTKILPLHNYIEKSSCRYYDF